MWERHSKFVVAAELIDICLDQRNCLHIADALKMLEAFGVLSTPREFVSECNPSLVYTGQMNKMPSIFQRALNREIFETAECLERKVTLNTVENVNTVKMPSNRQIQYLQWEIT